MSFQFNSGGIDFGGFLAGSTIRPRLDPDPEGSTPPLPENLPRAFFGWMDTVDDYSDKAADNVEDFRPNCLNFVIVHEMERGATFMEDYLEELDTAAAAGEKIGVISELPRVSLGDLANPAEGEPDPRQTDQREAWEDLSSFVQAVQAAPGHGGFLVWERVDTESAATGITPKFLHLVYDFLARPEAYRRLGEAGEDDYQHAANKKPVLITFGAPADPDVLVGGAEFDLTQFAPTAPTGRVADYYGFHLEQLPEATGEFAPALAAMVEGYQCLANALMGDRRLGREGLFLILPANGESTAPGMRYATKAELRYLGFGTFLHSGAEPDGEIRGDRGVVWNAFDLADPGGVDTSTIREDVQDVAKELCHYQPWLLGEALLAPEVVYDRSYRAPMGGFELSLTDFELGGEPLIDVNTAAVQFRANAYDPAPQNQRMFFFNDDDFVVELEAGTLLEFTCRKFSGIAGVRMTLFVEGTNFSGNRTYVIEEMFGLGNPTGAPGWRFDWGGDTEEQLVSVNLLQEDGLPASHTDFDQDAGSDGARGFLRRLTFEAIEFPTAARPATAEGAEALWRDEMSFGVTAHVRRDRTNGKIRLFLINSTPFERTVDLQFSPLLPGFAALQREANGVVIEEDPFVASGTPLTVRNITLKPLTVEVFRPVAQSPVFGRPMLLWWENATDFAPGVLQDHERHFDKMIDSGQNMLSVGVGTLDGQAALDTFRNFLDAVFQADPRIQVMVLIPRVTVAFIAWHSHFDEGDLEAREFVALAEEDPRWASLDLIVLGLFNHPSLAAFITFDEPNIYQGQRISLTSQRFMFPWPAEEPLSDEFNEDTGMPPFTPIDPEEEDPRKHYIVDMPFASADVLTSIRGRIEFLIGVNKKPIAIHFTNAFRVSETSSNGRPSPALWLDSTRTHNQPQRTTNDPNRPVDLTNPEIQIGEKYDPAWGMGNRWIGQEVVPGIDVRAFRDCADLFFLNDYPLKVNTFQYTGASDPVVGDLVSDPGWSYWNYRRLEIMINSDAQLNPLSPHKPVILHAQAWGIDQLDLNPLGPHPTPEPGDGMLGEGGGENRLGTRYEVRLQAWASALVSRQGASWFARFFCPWVHQLDTIMPVAKEIEALSFILQGEDLTESVLGFPIWPANPPLDPIGNRVHVDPLGLFVRVNRAGVDEFWFVGLNPAWHGTGITFLLDRLGLGHSWSAVRRELEVEEAVGPDFFRPLNEFGAFFVALKPYEVLILRLSPA